MTTLVITRGLPASGKTTLARAWVAAEPSRARCNRDDVRAMLFDAHGVLGPLEQTVTAVQQAAVSALLRAGVSTIVDDTNLRLRFARAWADLAAELGCAFEVIEVDTDVEECVRRDAARAAQGGREVGAAVIREMNLRFRGREPIEASSRPAHEGTRYEAAPGTPPAVLVDLDGTVALMGARGPYDEHLVHLDTPAATIVEIVRSRGERLIFCSGRSEGCREATEAWIRTHVVPDFEMLLMRAEGDKRRDAIVKRELFDAHIRDAYDVRFVLDDRQQVVDMFRGLGLTVLQVAEGNF